MDSMFPRSLSAVSLLLSLSAACGQNPVKMAAVARFDVQGDAHTAALTNGAILAGEGSVGRHDWLAPAEQTNTYTVEFPISPLAWTNNSFRFTPARSGLVRLTLRGPWLQSTGGGPLYKQEVLWDACSSVNASIPNGSFETILLGLPAGWWRTYGTDGTVDTGPVPPVDGTNYARVWHEGPLSCYLTVTGGAPVTLTVHARAVVPTNSADRHPSPNVASPAHAATNPQPASQ